MQSAVLLHGGGLQGNPAQHHMKASDTDDEEATHEEGASGEGGTSTDEGGSTPVALCTLECSSGDVARSVVRFVVVHCGVKVGHL